jgi:putative ABC transport system permease protein
MVPIARKNLLYDKSKFLVCIVGFALSTLLIFALLGIYFGVIQQSRNIPITSGADYWISEQGARNLFNSSSFLPPGQAERLEQINGVEKAVPTINRTTTIQIDGKDVTTAVVGYDTETEIGKAGTIYKGNSNVGSGETIIDRALAQKHGLKLGDKIQINGADFEISGMTDDTNALEFQYAFISYEDAMKTLHQKAVNFYLVNLSGEPTRQIKDDIAAVLPTGELKTKETVAQGNEDVISESFLPIVGLLVFIGLAVGTTVIGLTIYTATTERAKEYGVLKAVGVKNKRLFLIILQQTVISSVVGFVLGVGLYFAVLQIAFYAVPIVYFSLGYSYFVTFFAVSLATGILASLIPLRKISRIDPVETFTS